MEEFSFPAIAVDPCSLPFPHFAASPLWFQMQPKARSEEAAKTDEERMDLLWESFNEELRRLSYEHKREKSLVASVAAELCCLRALSESDGSRRSIVHRRRPSVVLILKVLKKLFLFQNG
ncbi:hypothetical protein Cni_G11077 [Canna indica]|uniref:Uncharacterized protein n=1 Tax=Canna indica TaxID=4628 RepID=A0AAQ3K5E3_9LILI|nr:hypothetical protein Cni_G11077 [Canna indica]